MSVQLSVILLLRDREAAVAAMVREAVEAARGVVGVQDGFEVLAVDELSGDNTLSRLSVLQAKVPQLRTIQEVREGTAVAQAARTARGAQWLFLDREVEPELLLWGLRQLSVGQRAAFVPGEILAVEARLGAHVLANLHGGLVSAQHTVARELSARGGRPATRPAPDRGLTERALLFLRGHLGLLGLGQLDRPRST